MKQVSKSYRPLSFFPQPEQHETIYSLISRFHILSGHNGFSASMADISDRIDGESAAELPGFLLKLSSVTGISIDHLVNEMTDVHLYQPFISMTKYQELVNALKTSQTHNIQQWLGSISNRIPPNQHLLFCPKCVEYDISELGFSIWHIEHQLPGMITCPYHHVTLQKKSKSRKRACLPQDCFCQKTLYDKGPADQLSQLIIDCYMYHETSFCEKTILDTYYSRLKTLGFSTKCNRIRQIALRESLSEIIMPVIHTDIYLRLHRSIQKHQYPECLFYQPSQFHHPIKHLLLIFLLFGSWRRFVEEYNRPEKTLFHNNCVPPLKATMLTCKKSLALESLKNGNSLRKSAEISQLSVSTVKTICIQNNIEPNRRPSKINTEMRRQIWRKLLIGKATSDIALQCKVSKGAVEQLLSQNSYLVPVRIKIKFFQTRKRHREKIQNTIAKNPKYNRKHIISQERKSYSWLYKHDKIWLYKTLPKETPRQLRYKKINLLVTN